MTLKMLGIIIIIIFFFKQKTAYEIGTGDWSSDVCSSDLSLTYYTDRCKQEINSLVLVHTIAKVYIVCTT